MLLEKPKQIKKERPFLSAILISNECLSSEDYTEWKLPKKPTLVEIFRSQNASCIHINQYMKRVF